MAHCEFVIVIPTLWRPFKMSNIESAECKRSGLLSTSLCSFIHHARGLNSVYLPIISFHHMQIVETLKLVRRELSGESIKAV